MNVIYLSNGGILNVWSFLEQISSFQNKYNFRNSCKTAVFHKNHVLPIIIVPGAI